MCARTPARVHAFGAEDTLRLVRAVLRAADLASAEDATDVEVVVACLPSGRTAQRAAVVEAVDAFPHLPVVAVLDVLEPSHLQRLLRSGIRGLLGLGSVDSQLLPAIDALRSGLLCVPPEIGSTVSAVPLTPREKEVLALVVMGLTNGEIARRLFLSEATVKTHLGATFRKLGARSRGEAAQILSETSEGFGVGVLTLGGSVHFPTEATD